ncbi:MAG: Asp-tRNA(Asn)/Glu-tRNA(Gln) amidotransferase subunit GatA [Sphingobacteriia bacterium]|nr:Asp-tRNA(Asn)/Glu-tRNA(Gln) amidotransferase subunit GatA [Sphingobacteriia bacterium]
MSLIDLTIVEAKEKLLKKEISVKELIEAHIKQAEKLKNLNAFVLETFEQAFNKAEVSQQKITSGNPRLLEGIPVAVKDLFCTENVRTTACSNILKNYVPQYESTVSAKFFENGAIMLGKTNMDDTAMGSSNLTSCFGPCENPWRGQSNPNEKLVPGGSSGGSAIAVSSRMAMAALGSDTGGSIRQPASFTGSVGIKPSYGRCSRYGMIAYSSSLDQAGVFTRTVSDAALALEAIMGSDEFDSTVLNNPVPRLSQIQYSELKGLRVGIPKEYHNDMVAKEITDLWQQGADWLRQHGAEIVEISLPHTRYALPVYYIVAPAEASTNLARYDGVRYGHRTSETVQNINDLYELTRAEGFGEEVQRRILVGTFVLSSEKISSYFQKAQKVRTLVIQDFKEAFSKVDVILTPTALSAAFSMDAKLDPVSMYLNDVYTIPASLAGLPCVSIPATLSNNGLPLGLQLIAKHLDEETLIKASLALEKAANFKYKPNTI